jgi:predicted phosphoribosyltransferase
MARPGSTGIRTLTTLTPWGGSGSASRFRDRSAAGRALARRLGEYAGRPDVLVLALPRGGVVIGFEVARALRLPLDVLVVRKLGVPGHAELAMGAIASGGASALSDGVIRALGIPAAAIEAVVAHEQRELARRELAYRGTSPAPSVVERTVLLVDDGLATGSTMRAAIASLRQRRAARIVVAAPVGAAETCAELERDADEVVCVLAPEPFYAVGEWYEDFDQTSDDEVRELLARAAHEIAGEESR